MSERMYRPFPNTIPFSVILFPATRWHPKIERLALPLYGEQYEILYSVELCRRNYKYGSIKRNGPSKWAYWWDPQVQNWARYHAFVSPLQTKPLLPCQWSIDSWFEELRRREWDKRTIWEYMWRKRCKRIGFTLHSSGAPMDCPPSPRNRSQLPKSYKAAYIHVDISSTLACYVTLRNHAERVRPPAWLYPSWSAKMLQRKWASSFHPIAIISSYRAPAVSTTYFCALTKSSNSNTTLLCECIVTCTWYGEASLEYIISL